MIEIFILLGLILINGFFAMAEIAVVSSRKARLESQSNKGDLRAKEALKLAEHPEKFLSTVQIGITLVSILTGFYSGESFKDELAGMLSQVEMFKPYATGLATALLVIIVTYVSLVLELVPKRIGFSKPESIAKFVAAPMKLISIIAYPFIWLLTKSTHVVITLLRVKSKDNQVTEEEIKAIISEGTEQGTIEEAEQEIIERVFHLGDRNITSLMTHRSDIIWFDLNDNEVTIKDKIMKEPHSAYPICDGDVDNIKGVVSIKDLYIKNDLVTFKEYMKPANFVPENITTYKLLEQIKQYKMQTCFIVDEYGSVQGMVTLNDILGAIVGDIPQEDTADFEITEREDGSYLVDAQIPFYDFLSRFEKTEWMNEGEQDFDTLAGFILHKLERIPVTGDSMEWQGFKLEIIDMDAQRIDKVMVTLSDEIKEQLED